MLSRINRAAKRLRSRGSPDHREKGTSSTTSHNNTSPSRFHNLSDVALADSIGRAVTIMKGAEAELTALKYEFKARGLTQVAGDEFAVSATEQISGRLDSNAVKAFLGDACFKFEKAIVSTVIRVKASERLALAA
jgi:hypothetical protein